MPYLTVAGYAGKQVTMQKRPALLSYRMRISLAMALFAIVPFLIAVIGFVYTEEPQLAQKVLSQHVQMLEVYKEQLTQGFQELQTKTLYVKNNTTIRNYLNRKQTLSMVEKLQFVSEIQEVERAISLDSNELMLRWYSDCSDYNYGGYIYTKEDLANLYAANEEYLTQILEMETNETLMLICGPEYGFEEHIVSVYTRIDNINGSDHILEISLPIAQMVYHTKVELPGTHVIGVCYEQGDSHQTVVLLGNNAQAQAFLEEYCLTGQSEDYYPLEVAAPAQLNGRIICLLQDAYVSELFFDSRMPLLTLVLVLIVMVLCCSYITSRLLTRKVIQFISHINNQLDHGVSEQDAENDGGDGLSDIAQRVRELVDRSREQGKQLEALELEKKRMELELLQMRFNPHLLYNTLGSIRYQIKDKRLIKSIDSLIAYYRIVLSKGSLLISIESEIQMIQAYLTLQTFAFNLQGISYVYDIEDGVKGFTIIKHLLQPIVENALDHGLRGMQGCGTITVRARLQDQNMVFEIEDTGVGMTPEQIVQITTNPSSSLQMGGYGVFNVIQRIKTYYGPEYGIAFFSEPGKGTLARITIPQEIIPDRNLPERL